MADLNGKTVGVTQKVSLTDYWANRAASIAGITINTIPLGGGVVPGVKAKQVDAGIVWPIYSYKAIADDTLRPVFSLSEKLPPSVSEGVAVAQDMIDNHPDVLKRWLAATSETISTLQSDEPRAEEVLKDYFKENNPQVLKAVYKDFIMNIHPDGVMKKEWMEDSMQAAEFFGDKEPLSLDKIFNTAFTPIQTK